MQKKLDQPISVICISLLLEIILLLRKKDLVIMEGDF